MHHLRTQFSALILITGISVSSAAEFSNLIRVEGENNASVKRCADALINQKHLIAEVIPAELKTIINAEMPKSTIERRQISEGVWVNVRKLSAPYIVVTDRGTNLELPSIPFLFRDAGHVQAFLGSDIYLEVRDNPMIVTQTQPRLAIAYGGFYQIFSKVAAVTEPKHFYNRWIGGTVRGRDVYYAFNGLTNPSAQAAQHYTNIADALASEALGRNDPLTHMVEAHLASAIENGFLNNGRYVNLISSSVMPVIIHLRNPGSIELSNNEVSALKKWAEAAAAECSRAIFQKELDTLDQLKSAGYQIVPFNRKAMEETSWRLALEGEHAFWTIEQLDRIVKLGDAPAGTILPSSLVAQMTPEKRKSAISHNNAAKKKRAEWLKKQ